MTGCGAAEKVSVALLDGPRLVANGFVLAVRVGWLGWLGMVVANGFVEMCWKVVGCVLGCRLKNESKLVAPVGCARNGLELMLVAKGLLASD